MSHISQGAQQNHKTLTFDFEVIVIFSNASFFDARPAPCIAMSVLWATLLFKLN